MESLLFLRRCAQLPVEVLRIYGRGIVAVIRAQRERGGTEVSHGLVLSLISGLVESPVRCSGWLERERYFAGPS